jgi:hypothetical protein
MNVGCFETGCFAVLVSGVLALAKLGFLNFITGRFDTGCFGVGPSFKVCRHF